MRGGEFCPNFMRRNTSSARSSSLTSRRACSGVIALAQFIYVAGIYERIYRVESVLLCYAYDVFGGNFLLIQLCYQRRICRAYGLGYR